MERILVEIINEIGMRYILLTAADGRKIHSLTYEERFITGKQEIIHEIHVIFYDLPYKALP